MRAAALWGILLVAAFAAVVHFTRPEPPGRSAPSPSPPPAPAEREAAPAEADLALGRDLFQRSCMVCHGPEGRGSRQGPPLVHPVYEPGHHADEAFLLAVQRGVRAHHWQFGDMPPLPGVSPAEVKRITAYVRDLQKKAGLF